MPRAILAPQGPARRLADLGYPLYTFPFGQARGLGQARDVALKDLSVNQTVYVKNELTVHGTARIDGFAGQTIPVQLLFETPAGKMAAGRQRRKSRPRQSGEAVPIELTTIPQTPGEYKVTLRVPKQPGELVTTNNELSTFVTVLKGGVNVLYLEGALRVDQKLLAALARRLARYQGRLRAARPARSASSGRSICCERFQPRQVRRVHDRRRRCVVFHAAEELQALADVVKQGAGLVMLGGFHTFGPGGYSDTPLARLLPVTMDPSERQRLGDPIRSDVQLPGPLENAADASRSGSGTI